jgi:capsular exopolysaccharide synthesis family protein
MSRIYDALRRMERDRSPEKVEPGTTEPVEFLQSVAPEPADLSRVRSVDADVSDLARLVSLADPQGLGAEKFRALATRLENLRHKKELKSLQVTSCVPNEGKTLVATNLAVTFAESTGAKILLVEGDLHRPSLHSVLGLKNLQGTTEWWAGKDQEMANYIYRLKRTPLWFLPAGGGREQPSNILQSGRFAEALLQLVGAFDWIIVDSTPLLPFADANLWSRLLDGMLLVIREGVAPVKALKKGLEAIDNPNLVGVVVNDASEVEDRSYHTAYYLPQKHAKLHA